MNKDCIIKLENVHKSYAQGIGPETSVLSSIDLEINRGEAVAVLGPSGSGKSTLLNIMGTLDTVSEGRILINGDDPSTMTDIQQARIRNSEIGFVFQLHHLLPQCTVLENVLLPLLANKKEPSGEVQERALHLLDRVGLTSCAARKPGQLSGGECQRVAVVRALINRPTILLADEPTGSLDKSHSAELGQLLMDLNGEEQITMVVVTHSESLAEKIGKTLTLSEGRLTPSAS
jgi:lipoprotein-releasing system ATP-binding protein